MRLTITWMLNGYLYFIMLAISSSIFISNNFRVQDLWGITFSLIFILLICSIINKLILKKFFPYPKGEFVEQLKEEFLKERYSERVYLSLRDFLISGIVLLSIGMIGKSITPIGINFLDGIILSGILFLILILRVIFKVYQKLKPLDN